MEVFYQEGFKKNNLFKIFNEDVNVINGFIEKHKKQIIALNNLGTNSKVIEDFLKEILEKQGYKYETKQNLFRPDYIKFLNKGKILVEVERGKTINNNMDLLDFWKCHICCKIGCLILIVPEKVPRKNKSQLIYKTVIRRMRSFFIKENYCNVKAIAIIDY